MPKIVVNACYGGFGISEAGMLRYAELKGMTLYPEPGQFSTMTYYTVPPEQRVQPLSPEEWVAATAEQRMTSNDAYSSQTIHCSDISRDDPALGRAKALGSDSPDRAHGRRRPDGHGRRPGRNHVLLRRDGSAAANLRTVPPHADLAERKYGDHVQRGRAGTVARPAVRTVLVRRAGSVQAARRDVG